MLKYVPLKKLKYGAVAATILYIILRSVYQYDKYFYIYDIFLVSMWLVTYILLISRKSNSGPYKDIREIIYDNRYVLSILFCYKLLIYLLFNIALLYNFQFDYQYAYNFEVAFMPILFLFPFSKLWY